MAKAVLLLFLTLLSGAASPAYAADGEKKETRIRVYWHDVLSGPNPTAVRVAQAAGTNTSMTSFGAVTVIDNALTEGPELGSRLVGRAQGTYISAGKDVLAFLMTMNFVFQAGEHNGSTVAIFGRNEAMSQVREMAVVGGTGAFRLARGYALATSRALDFNTGDATVEYNLFITH
jgi:hypothetical protein